MPDRHHPEGDHHPSASTTPGTTSFRRLCLDQGQHVCELLGRLVANEVTASQRPIEQPTVLDEADPDRVDRSTRERDHTTVALSLFD